MGGGLGKQKEWALLWTLLGAIMASVPLFWLVIGTLYIEAVLFPCDRQLVVQ